MRRRRPIALDLDMRVEALADMLEAALDELEELDADVDERRRTLLEFRRSWIALQAARARHE